MLIDWTCPFFPNVTVMWVVVSLLVVWEMAWKGIALWRAGRNGHIGWFVAILVLNTLGILPIVYIFGFSKSAK